MFFFFNFERFLPFLTFFSSKKSSLFLLRDENFFSLNRSNGASKNPAFRTDFKNVHMTFVKSAPKKSFSQKTIYQLKICLSPKKSVFWAKLFLVALFTEVICTFCLQLGYLNEK